MRGATLLVLLLLLLGAPVKGFADPPVSAAPIDLCQAADNHILGPRTRNQPLPLVTGDAASGFRSACAVPWSTLSPNNQALAVVGCYRGNLLQIANTSACGHLTGPLWVSARWVMTSAEWDRSTDRAATCQQLETGAYAVSRDFEVNCKPRALQDSEAPKAVVPAPPPTAAPAPATPAGKPPANP